MMGIGWVSGITLYILLWWWIFFMTLPFGVRPDKKPGRGNAESAPARPMLWRKAAITSVIALVLWFVAVWLINSGLFSFRDSVRGW